MTAPIPGAVIISRQAAPPACALPLEQGRPLISKTRQLRMPCVDTYHIEHVAFCLNRGDSQETANQIQVVVQMEVDSDGEALFDGFARARDEACCGR